MPSFPSLPSSTDPALLAALQAEGGGGAPMGPDAMMGPAPGEPVPPADPMAEIPALAMQIQDLAAQIQALLGGGAAG